MESLHGLIDEIQRQHSPELRSFAVNEVNLTGYTDEHNMLQAMITLKKRQGVETGLDQITGLTLAFFIGNSTLSTDSGHEYKWCQRATELGSHPAESRKSRKQRHGGKQAFESQARSQLRC